MARVEYAYPTTMTLRTVLFPLQALQMQTLPEAPGPYSTSTTTRQTPTMPPGSVRVNKYETVVPLRLDIAAALVYALGPLTGVLFLIIETKNDYLRFHAWQSSLVFVCVLMVHAFFGLFSSTMAWLIFGLEITLGSWLGYQAYINADTLARYQVPYFGPMASTWVDSE
ncbi:hypothetical protein BASA60_010030 [Batrachochytrium salamandrivorans]|nr:hypothetical protein BASA60_010030 [Batrachochytrium salamandrivorans]